MFDVLIYIPLWKRSTLFNRVAKNLHYQTGKVRDIRFKVLCCISPDDPEKMSHELTCKTYGFDHFYFDNYPLGAKMNAGVKRSLKYDYDYLMTLGSDDLIHEQLFEIYLPYMKNGALLFGMKELYFADLETRKAMKYMYKNSTVIGAGRMIHRRVIDEMYRINKPLYNPAVEKGLDMNSKTRICNTLGIKQDAITSMTDFPYIVDLKSDVNIWSFNDIKRHNELMRNVNYDLIMSYF